VISGSRPRNSFGNISQELDDYFEIVIDSSHNPRNAYMFQFNPLGTQRDALITDEQDPQDDVQPCEVMRLGNRHIVPT
jgi:hypothetical protein